MEVQTFSLRSEVLEGGVTLVHFSGTLNEDAYLQYIKLVDILPSECVFDFGGVGFINSTGIRDWIKFMLLIQKGRKITFERCTDSFLGNINLMPYMIGKATLTSVLRNCTCSKCHSIDAVALRAGQDFDSDGKLMIPIPKCRSCQTELTWDIPDNEYFLFLRPD